MSSTTEMSTRMEERSERSCCRCSNDEKDDVWGTSTTSCSNCNNMRCQECHIHESATASAPSTISTPHAANIIREPDPFLSNNRSPYEFIYPEETTASMKVNDGFNFNQSDVPRDVPRSVSRPTPLESWCYNLERYESLTQGVSESKNLISDVEEILKSQPFSLSLEADSHFPKDLLLDDLEQIQLAGLSNSDSVSEKSNSSISETNNTSPLESFFNNPATYFEDVSSLEYRVLQLGNSTFKNITRRDGQSVLPIPKFEFDTTPFSLAHPHPFSRSEPFSPYQRPPSLFRLRMIKREAVPAVRDPSTLVSLEERVCIAILASLETLLAIRGGIELLHDEGFSNNQGYSIIAVDPDRPRVLKIRSINLPTLIVLEDLLREGASKEAQWDPILEDVSELVSHIVASLGLGIPGTILAQQREDCICICLLLSAVLSVLHIGLMSFIRSHIDISGAVPSGALEDGLQIEAPGGHICLAARRLQCLHGLLKQPVWAFNFIPTDYKLPTVHHDGFYISSSIDDLAKLWGPFRLGYAENGRKETVSSIETRGGEILAIDSSDCDVQLLDDEIPCHWFGWLDVSEKESRNKVVSIDSTKRLLIGIHGLDRSDCNSPNPRKRRKHCIQSNLEVADECSCIGTYASSYEIFDLGTRGPSWTLDAKSKQASGGKYITVSMGFTYKFDAGWTLKDVILESWIDAVKDDVSHVPNPYYMDCFVVLDISRCSGHAQRISLWKLLRSADLLNYFRQILEAGVFRETEMVLKQYSSDSSSDYSFAKIWPELDTNKRNVLTSAFRIVLKLLRCTGVGEDGELQAWDITAIPRVDGRRIDPQWAKMTQDDIGCATFAIITGTCRKYTPPDQAHGTPPAILPVLHTQVCITANQKLNQTNADQKEREVPPHLDESNARSFSSKWSVSRSSPTDIKLAGSLDTIESRRGEMLLEGIRGRQRARRVVSDSSWVNNSTDIAVPPRSINSSGYSTSDSRRVYNNPRPISSNEEPQRNRLPGPVECDVNLSFRNGRDQKVGELLLEPVKGSRNSIDLNSLSETSALPAIWKAKGCGGVLDAIYEKGEQMDRNFSSRMHNSSAFIPRLICRIAKEEDLGPSVVTEYIRPGRLTDYQKVLTLYIR